MTNEAPAKRRGGAGPRKWPASKIEMWKVDRLRPYARNAKTHPDDQIAAIARSIEEFGFTIPILADEDGRIIAGHGREQAARRLGLTEVPVIIARGWSEDQKRAYTLADNKLTERGEWDEGLLKLELGELRVTEGFDLGLTGFDAGELDKLLATPEPPAAPDEFPSFDEDVPTEHQCPKCGYAWSGKAS